VIQIECRDCGPQLGSPEESTPVVEHLIRRIQNRTSLLDFSANFREAIERYLLDGLTAWLWA